MQLLIPRTCCLKKKKMEMLLLWNVIGLCPLVIWTRPVGVKLLAFDGKRYLFGQLKLGLSVTLIWTRTSSYCVRTEGRNKTLRGCAIRPPEEDNIIHTRTLKCDEAFSVVYMHQVQAYQIWTNQYVMNSYIMLLIMREWFCLNALWKVKNSHEKKFLRKRKAVKDKSFWNSVVL